MVLTMVESRPEDVWVETNGITTTSSTSFADAATLNISPATAGDYLIFGYCLNDPTSDTRVNLRMDIDGAASHGNELAGSGNSATTYFAVKKVSLSSATTAKLQYATISSGQTAAIGHRRILALRCDTLRMVASDYSAARITTSSTSPQDAASVTVAAEASVDYLTIGNAFVDHSSSTSSRNARLLLNDAAGAAMHHETANTAVQTPYAAIASAQYGAGSITQKLQYWAEAQTTGIKDRGVYVLDLRAPVAEGLDVPPVSVTLASWSPALRVDRFVGSIVASAVLQGRAPTLAADRVVTIPFAGCSFGAYAPAVVAEAAVSVSRAELSDIASAPNIIIDAACLVPMCGFVSTARVPGVAIEASVALPASSLSADGLSPRVLADLHILAPAPSAALAALGPEIIPETRMAVPVAALAMAGPMPARLGPTWRSAAETATATDWNSPSPANGLWSPVADTAIAWH